MSVGRFVKYSFVAVAAMLGTATCSDAADQAVQMPATVVVSTPLLASDMVPASQDGLHQDKRWPKFANCIENTGSQEEFVSCLRTAFLTDTTGTELAMLLH